MHRHKYKNEVLRYYPPAPGDFDARGDEEMMLKLVAGFTVIYQSCECRKVRALTVVGEYSRPGGERPTPTLLGD